MSTSPEAKYNLETKKLVVNLMLNVPIEIELEVSQNLPTEYSQLSSQEVDNQTDNFEEIAVKGKLSQCNSIEDVLIPSSQIKEILTKAIEHHQILPSLPISEYEVQENNSKENLFKHKQIEQLSPQEINITRNSITRFDKQPILRVVDLFNDGLVFTVNTVGAMLFLGKVANYSWEGDTIESS